MAILGELAVNLIARTQKFDKGFQKSQKRLNQFEKAARTVDRALSTLGIGLSAVGVVEFGRRIAISTDELAKASDKLGLSIERLQAYQFGAKLAGIETTTLNTALQRMARRVSEAAKGAGEAKDAIAELGLNAEVLSKFNVAQQYETIGEAFRKIGSQSDRIRLAMRIFDTEGVSLVNAFAAGVKESRIEFEKLDVAIDREAAAAIEKMNDKITLMNTKLDAVGRRLLSETAPLITRLVQLVSGEQLRTPTLADTAGVRAPVPTARGTGQAISVREQVRQSFLSAEQLQELRRIRAAQEGDASVSRLAEQRI